VTEPWSYCRDATGNAVVALNDENEVFAKGKGENYIDFQEEALGAFSQPKG
jgi:hypothetical protein